MTIAELDTEDIRARYTGNRIETDYGDEVRFLLERLDEAREERDRLAAVEAELRACVEGRLRALHSQERRAREASMYFDDKGEIARLRKLVVPSARGESHVARIRAEARAEALEEAAQELERRAGVEGDKKWAAAYRKAATRIRALNDGKDG